MRPARGKVFPKIGIFTLYPKITGKNQKILAKTCFAIKPNLQKNSYPAKKCQKTFFPSRSHIQDMILKFMVI